MMTYFSRTLASALLFCSGTAMAQGSDECSGAGYAVLGFTQFDATLATDSLDPINAATCGFGGAPTQDLWFKYEVIEAGDYEFAVAYTPIGYDTKMVVYDGDVCPVGSFNVLGCNDDTSAGLDAKVLVPLVSGQRVLVRVGSANSSVPGDAAEFRIRIVYPVPVNDDCQNAIPIGLGITPMNAISATNSYDYPGGCYGFCPLQDVWFTFTPTVTQVYEIETVRSNGNSYDTVITLFDVPGCPLVIGDALNSDDDGGERRLSLLRSPLIANRTYLFSVGSYPNHPTTVAPIGVAIRPFGPPPANDDCDNAAVAFLGLNPFDSSAATDGAGAALDPLICDLGMFSDQQIYQDVWFAFTPTISEPFDIAVVSDGFYVRSYLFVYGQSSCPDDPALLLGCATPTGNPSNEARLSGLQLTAGVRYLIRVGSRNTNTVENPAVLSITSPLSPGFAESCSGLRGTSATGCTNCPCGNYQNVFPGRGGCLNSAGTGARLIASGYPSVSLPPGSQGDLRFRLAGIPASVLALLVSGDAVAPGNMANPCFGMNSGVEALAYDGIRCAIGNFRRHGGRVANAEGEVGTSTSPWGGEGNPQAGLARAGVGFLAGQTRYFQAINRDDPLASCMRGLNTSQAVEVTFLP